MAVTITKKFWNSTGTQYDDLSKVVFTSPNLESPAAAGTRSHILPGSQYIALWFEAVDYMHRVYNDQDGPTSQETYFAKMLYDSDSTFNFAGHTEMDVRSDYVLDFDTGQVVNYDKDNYGIVGSVVSRTPSAIGDTNGNPDNDSPFGGTICSGVDYLYRIAANDSGVYRYNVSDNQWNLLSNSPSDFGNYCAIASDEANNKLYMVRGTGDTFWEYDISGDVWTNLQECQIDATETVSLVRLNRTIYYLQTNTSTLYKYEIDTDSWSIDQALDTEYSSMPVYWGGLYYNNYSATGLYAVALVKNAEVAAKLIIGGSSGYNTICHLPTISGTFSSSTIVDSVNITCDSLANSTQNSFGDILTFTSLACHEPGNPVDYYAAFCIKGPQNSFDEYKLSFSDQSDTFFTLPSGSNYSRAPIAALSNDYYTMCGPNTENDYLYKYSPTEAAGIGTKTYLCGEGFGEIDSSNLVYLNNHIYLSEGKHSNDVWKCDVSTSSGTWSKVKVFPTSSTFVDRRKTQSLYDAMDTDGTDIYKFRGLNSHDFYKLNVGTNSWSQLADSPGIIEEYGCMTYVSGTNSLYVVSGEHSSSLWRFDIGAGTWNNSLSSSPAGFGIKCSIEYPKDVGGDYIYALRGQHYEEFMRYSISGDSWEYMKELSVFNNFAWGLTSSGSKMQMINDTTVYEYTIGTNTWETVGTVNYPDNYKKFTNDASGNLHVYGDSGLRSYDLTASGTGGDSTTAAYGYDITFSSVAGTSVITKFDSLFTWKDNIVNSSVWSHAQNSVIFEVSSGEAYTCKLTAWDDDTHTTITNKVLNEGHYKVVCSAYRGGDGTKQVPVSNNYTNLLIHPPGINLVLKGDVSYYGYFDLVNVANGGVSGNEHGEYLIFTPRLDEMDDSFSSGNYDFVTTLHYQYT